MCRDTVRGSAFRFTIVTAKVKLVKFMDSSTRHPVTIRSTACALIDGTAVKHFLQSLVSVVSDCCPVLFATLRHISRGVRA